MFGQKRKSFKFVSTDWEREDGYVDGAGAETVEEHGSDFFDHGELDLGKFARKGREARREKVRGDGGNHTDGDGATDERFAFHDVAPGGLEFAKDGSGAREECFAEFRESDGAAQAASSSSSLRICWESEGWEMWECSAARLKEPVSATAQK
jgi:hypothetical protein